MKKIIAVIMLLATVMVPAAELNAQSKKDALSALGGILSKVTSKSGFDLSELEGTWKYNAPAVTFKSDNAASAVGGVAGSAVIESKIGPYYKKIGLDKTVLTVDSAMNFTMKLRTVTLKGTISRQEGDDTHLVFNFSAMGKIKLGSVAAVATKSNLAGMLTLTFDASKLIAMLEKIAAFTKNSSLQTLSKLVSSYDGIYIGAKLKKQK